jgi:hypothetical protein
LIYRPDKQAEIHLTNRNILKNEDIMKGESKEERFRRVAQKRVQNVLDSLRRLSQCANKRMYSWNDDQLTKIWSAIDHELKSCKEGFETAEPEQFRL